jgi:hypothetical protein
VETAANETFMVDDASEVKSEKRVMRVSQDSRCQKSWREKPGNLDLYDFWRVYNSSLL